MIHTLLTVWNVQVDSGLLPPRQIYQAIGAILTHSSFHSEKRTTLSSHRSFLELWLLTNHRDLTQWWHSTQCSFYPRISAIQKMSISGWDGCILYVRNSIPTLLCQDPQLNHIQDPMILIAKASWFDGMSSTRLFIERFSTRKWRNYINFHSPGSNVAGDFNAPERFWFTFVAFSCLLPFASNIQQGESWKLHRPAGD